MTVAELVKQFVNERAQQPEPHFNASTLEGYIEVHSNAFPAPGTVKRYLRKLKKDGQVNYNVIDRKRSLYLALPVENKSNE